MLIPMLKAVANMLKDCKDAKVECAKGVLDELIQHLEATEPRQAISHTTPIQIVGDSDLDEEALQAQEELAP